MDYYGMNKVNPCAPPREVPSNNRCYYENQIPPTSPNRGRGSNVDENMHNNMQNYTESYFWRRFDSHINQVTPEGLKDLRMPLARVKRMMKSDDDVKVSRILHMPRTHLTPFFPPQILPITQKMVEYHLS